MGNTTNIDLNKEVPVSDLKLPPEATTPEVKALYQEMMDKTPAVPTGPVNHELSAVLYPTAMLRDDGDAPEPEKVPLITYDHFKAIEIVVGAIVAAKPVKDKDKLVHLVVDVGGTRGAVNVIAGILKSFPDPTVLLGKRYAFVVNLPPRKMAGIESQAMLLAATSADDSEKVVPVEVPGAEIGARLS